MAFPRATRGSAGSMSFSGLKTAAAARQHRDCQRPSGAYRLCASFQAAVVEQLVRKAGLALLTGPGQGGCAVGRVACNRGLRAAMQAVFTSDRIFAAAALGHRQRGNDRLRWLPSVAPR